MVVVRKRVEEGVGEGTFLLRLLTDDDSNSSSTMSVSRVENRTDPLVRLGIRLIYV